MKRNCERRRSRRVVLTMLNVYSTLPEISIHRCSRQRLTKIHAKNTPYNSKQELPHIMTCSVAYLGSCKGGGQRGRPKGEAKGGGQRGRSKGEAKGGGQRGRPKGETKGGGQRGRPKGRPKGEAKGKAKGGGQRGQV